MIIDLEDGTGAVIDTNTGSREELVKAIVAVHRWWTHVRDVLDEHDRALKACGLSFIDEAFRPPFVIEDDDKALAWFDLAQAQRIAERTAGAPANDDEGPLQ